MPTVNQPSYLPTNKLVAAALVTIIAWALATFAGIDLPPGVQEALSLLIGVAVAYFVKDRDNTP